MDIRLIELRTTAGFEVRGRVFGWYHPWSSGLSGTFGLGTKRFTGFEIRGRVFGRFSGLIGTFGLGPTTVN